MAEDMIERAAKAVLDWRPREASDGEPFPRPSEAEMRHGREIARAALLAALDPHDSKLQDVILGAMGFCSERGEFGPMARVQAHDAIAALRAHAQGGQGISSSHEARD